MNITLLSDNINITLLSDNINFIIIIIIFEKGRLGVLSVP
jgi:hypothetical protein